MLFPQEIMKRKDGSEERLNFPPNSQAVSNDTSNLLENGQEGYGGGTEQVENRSEKEGYGLGGNKRYSSFQRLPSVLLLFLAALVAVLGMPSFASAVPILARESDNPGAAAVATTGDINPLKKAASESSSQPLLKQVKDMLDSSKASLQALATAGETNESSDEIMDTAAAELELDIIANTPRYKNDAGVDELQEMAAIMTLFSTHLSDPTFISSIPEQMHDLMQTLQQEMTNVGRAMEQIESIIDNSQIDSSSSSLSSLKPIANANTIKRREYEQSVTSQRRVFRVLNEGGTTDQNEQEASQEDSTFHQDKSYSSSFQHQTHARNHENLDELLVGQGRYARAHMNNWQGDRSHRRLQQDNDFCARVEEDHDTNEQKRYQCARLADCAKDYSLYDLFVYIHGDDIDFRTGTVDKRIKGFDEINMRDKLERIKQTSKLLADESFPDESCDDLLKEFHRFDEEIGSFGGIWQGGSVTSVCRGQGTSKFLSLQSIAQIMISLYNSNITPKYPSNYGTGIGKLPNATFFLPDEFVVDIFEEFVGCAGDIGNKLSVNETYKRLFEDMTRLQNPFASPQLSLSLPQSYKKDSKRDDHGKGDMTFLDTSFEFLDFVTVSGAKIQLDGNNATTFSDKLKKHLVASIAINEYFEDVFQNEGKDLVDLFNQDKISLSNLGVDPSERLTLCQGDCDAGSCADGLECFQRDEGGDGPPECKGAPKDDWDYCIETEKGSIVHVTKHFSDITQIKEVLDNGVLTGQLNTKTKEWLTVRPTLAEPQKKFTRSFLDASIAAIFGEKTSIGQVCSYAQGLKDEDVTTVPGFCCLDAPYEATYWGELYSCTHRSSSKEYKKGEAKHPSHCNKLAPFTAGFNEAACDSLSGTWCPNPRPCIELNNCITTMLAFNSKLANRKAFYQYLDDAPKINDPDMFNECADVREYFEYDRNFPDDDRICKEVQELQCFEEFSNLDGYATGTSNGRGDDSSEYPPLFMSTKLEKNTKVGFNHIGAKAWRSINYGLTKAVDFIEFAKGVTNTAQIGCEALPCDFASIAVKSTCVLSVVAVKQLEVWSFHLAKLALSISERIYSEVVPPTDSAYDAAERKAIYENVITNHKNIITTFKAVQQLKQMLGEVAEDINDLAEDINDLGEGEEGGDRRLQVAISCGKETACGRGDCKCAGTVNPNDRDPTKDCDCKPNYNFIMNQKGAGCDEFDSDGDNIIDFCEDRYPPSLLFANAALFKCDDANLTKHCYTEKVFVKYEHAENFLKDQVIVTDDCLILKGLDMDISREGTCSASVFTLVPRQNYTNCFNITTSNNKITNAPSNSPSGRDPSSTDLFTQTKPFVNPLVGPGKSITVQVDDENPSVTCGFHDIHQDNNKVHVDGGYLFHYNTLDETSGLAISSFMYTITDNCKDRDIDVDVVVQSNEHEEDKIVMLSPYQFTDVVKQVEFLYAPTSCELEPMSSPNCIKDIGIATRIRFYEIAVTATDSAGRQDTDTCHVIIVPQCGLDNTSEECEDINGISYLKKDHLKTLTNQSRVRFELATSKVVWGFGDLDQNFDNLHAEYNSRLVASAWPTTEPSSSPSVGKGKGNPGSAKAPNAIMAPKGVTSSAPPTSGNKSPGSTKAPNAIKAPKGDTSSAPPTVPRSGITKIESSAVVASSFIASAVVAFVWFAL